MGWRTRIIAWRAVGLCLLAALAACAPAAVMAPPGPGAAPAAASAPSAPAASSASAPSGPAALAPPERFRVSWSSRGGGYLPLNAALERGLFTQRGLEVETHFMSGAQAVPALIARDLDATYADGTALVRANLAGGDTVMLAPTTNVFPIKLLSAPSIQRVEDLRGKRLGVSRTGGTTDVAARYLLRHYGLAPGDDVALIQVGTGPEMFPALLAGAIDAGFFGQPEATQVKKQGYVPLYDLYQLPVEYPATAVGTTRAIVTDRVPALRAFIAGIVEAIAWTKQNRAEALKVLAGYSGIDDQEALEGTYDEYVPHYPQAPYPTETGVATILESIRADEPRAADARPADFIDGRFVHELDESGFIRSLYP